MSSSDSVPYAAIARLSSPDIVARLRTTCRRPDYDAAARVLADRERWLAQVEAKLARTQTELAELGAQVADLEERYLDHKAKYIEHKAKQSRGPSSGAIAAAAARFGRCAIIDLSSSNP